MLGLKLDNVALIVHRYRQALLKHKFDALFVDEERMGRRVRSTAYR